MKREDWFFAFLLGVFAIFIWLRDTAWMSAAEDTLPILISLPLFWWLVKPLEWREDVPDFPKAILFVAIALFILGILLNLTIFLALSWVMVLWTWLFHRTEVSCHPRIIKLFILPVMAFPWVSLDLDRVGWWFRLSGAWVTAYFYAFLGMDVELEGTNLLINSLPISVEAACAGMNTLQSMLIAGSVVDYFILGHSALYWVGIPLLVAIAWLANTVRIIAICGLALAISPEFAMSAFHTWGGWLVLMVMFMLTLAVFSAMEELDRSGNE